MYDVVQVIENIKGIYESNNTLRVLKDFERVMDELDMYVFENWGDGELVEGPIVNRHTVSCSFMWPRNKMPNPKAGERLLDYNCKVSYKKDFLMQPRKIKTPDDYRPGTKKGKIDRHPIWIVNVEMPKSLLFDMYKGYLRSIDEQLYGDEDNISTQPEVQATPDSDLEQQNDITQI